MTEDDRIVCFGNRAWTGVEQIFARYQASGNTVRAGQCWNFSGLMVGTMRTLGIVSRPVTCIGSAQDKNVPRDNIYTKYWKYANPEVPGDRTIIVDGSRQIDQRWNYHAWAEGLMARPDRPQYSGWQAVGGTPEILGSSGFYELGPAPVAAVKDRANGNYDVDFVTFEVDPVIVNRCLRRSGTSSFTISPQTPRLLRQVATRYTNQLITPVVSGNPDPMDVTNNYRNVPLPLTQGPATQFPPSLNLGADATGAVVLVNNDDVERNYVYTVAATACEYNGETLGTLGTFTGSVTVPPHGSDTVSITLLAALLVPWFSLADHVVWDIAAECAETEAVDVTSAVSSFDAPNVTVALSTDTTIRPTTWTRSRVFITAPTEHELTNVRLVIKSSFTILVDDSIEKTIDVGTVPAGTTVIVEEWCRAMIPSQVMLIGDVVCDQLRLRRGAIEIEIAGCSADFNNSGTGSIDDLFAFLESYFIESVLPCTNGLNADLNGDRCVSLDDLFTFLGLYFAGC